MAVDLDGIDIGELARRVQNQAAITMPKGLRFTAGNGAPSFNDSKGSLYMDNSTGILYANTSGSTTWTKVGLQT